MCSPPPRTPLQLSHGDPRGLRTPQPALVHWIPHRGLQQHPLPRPHPKVPFTWRSLQPRACCCPRRPSGPQPFPVCSSPWAPPGPVQRAPCREAAPLQAEKWYTQQMQLPVQKLSHSCTHVPLTAQPPGGRKGGTETQRAGAGGPGLAREGGCGERAAVSGTHTHTVPRQPLYRSKSHRDRRRHTGTHRWTQLGCGPGAHHLPSHSPSLLPSLTQLQAVTHTHAH